MQSGNNNGSDYNTSYLASGVYQLGDNNDALVIQSGDDNDFLVVQNGDDNDADVDQSGDGNMSTQLKMQFIEPIKVAMIIRLLRLKMVH